MPSNTITHIREAFEQYRPNIEDWTEAKAAGDIVQLDGNAAAASYLVISKDPFSAGTETQVTTSSDFDPPYEAAVGLHASQRTLGQELAVEFISSEPPIATVADIAIASVSQGTTTLTVNTAVPHGFRPSQRIGIYGCADSRMNYPALVVASTPSETQFTATAGPGGTIPSLTVGPFTSGFVYCRPALGYARNGTSMIFENATATNASFYVRSASGDALSSGTLLGNHSATILTTASVQAINAAGVYAFQPTDEYWLTASPDDVQWSNVAVDSTSSRQPLHKRTQVVPQGDVSYRLRFRATNAKGLSVPVAHIQNVAKTGTTTATVTTQTPHGLTTGDLITTYGVRDQTNFANLLAATAVASVIDANNFTVVWGSAVTASSQAGFVVRVNGGNLPSTLGYSAIVVQSVSRVGGNLVVVGNGSWTGLLIGDYVSAAALHDTSGIELNLDGAYRVRDQVTTTLTLEPIDGYAPSGSDFASVNCGGVIVKRTDYRVSFARVTDFWRDRFEIASRPSGDQSNAVPVVVQNTSATTISSGTVTTVTTLTGGGTAEDAATTANPHITGGVVRTAVSPTTLVAGDAARTTMTSGAATVTYPFAVPEAAWQATGVLTTATATALKAAGAAGIRNYVTSFQYQNTSATATTVLIQDNTTTIAQFNAPASMALPATVSFGVPIRGTAATVLNVICGTTGSNTLFNAQGFQAA